LASVVTVVANVAVAALPPIFRFATGVVDVTVNGAVPVATVEIKTGAEIFPVVVRLVPVAAPIFGVINVGDVSMTNFVPVPVCDATAVAFPTLVIGPVKLASVVTVEASVAVAALPVVLAALLGISADTNARNVGAPALPLGAANTVFAAWLASVPVNVPEPVTGDPVTVINAGRDNPTEVTVPVVGVVHEGASVVPFEVSTCPAEPLASNAVVLAPD
jgi:hypothetical protein